jgi:branched-chain amino acid transport system substrate-binding protein
MMRFRSFCQAATALVLFCATHAALSQGVTSDTVIIGRNADFSGPIGARVIENQAGADAYVDWINKRGGVNGRKIVIKKLDDKNDVKLSVVNAKKLIEEENAFLLFLPNSTPSTNAVLKEVAEPAGIPVVAPAAGPDSFHTPPKRVLFNLRAKYQAEIVEAIRYFTTVGQKRLALIHVDDAFGKDAIKGYETGIAQFKAQSVYMGSFDRDKLDTAKHIPRLLDIRPDAIIAVGSAKAIAEFIKEARKQGSVATFMTLSNNSADGFVKGLGNDAPGVVVAQVMPPPGSAVSKAGIEFREIAGAAGAPMSYAAMEGFIAAKLLVEGLKRAGRNLTRESFIRSMEGINGLDLGGIEVSYGPQDRTGSTFVELSIIGRDGKFRR